MHEIFKDLHAQISIPVHSEQLFAHSNLGLIQYLRASASG